ncbi:MAG: ribonuclease HI family protein [Deltaproteobacteria bacterium]|nr:ribonuclease HI family protein [Deltaproteobacteria bacterium]
MPPKAKDADLINRFLEDLSDSLDISKTIENLGIAGEDARAILKSLIKRPRKTAQPELFEALVPSKETPFRDFYTLNVDGGSRGNPGKAGAGAVITDPGGRIIKKLKKYLGITTNNIAEYNALLIGLEAARALNIEKIRVLADSELMVKQINGVYRVKNEGLKPLFNTAIALLKGFRDFKIVHIYREENSIADSLANEAMDGKK